jgi:uncharacterized protein (DUF433 family)
MATASDIHTAAGGLVVSDPGILGGKPVFRGTRLPVATLFDYLADGLSLDYFVETFPSVTREQAAAVLRYGWQRIESELAA